MGPGQNHADEELITILQREQEQFHDEKEGSMNS